MNKKLLYLFPSVIWAIFIVILSGLPSDNLPNVQTILGFPSDKVAHFLIYFTQEFLLCYTIKKLSVIGKLTVQKVLISVIIVFLFGLFMEWLQLTIFASRSASFQDVIANSIGLVSGLISYLGLQKAIKFL